MDGDAKAEHEATELASPDDIINSDIISRNNDRVCSQNEESPMTGECKSEICSDSANDAVHNMTLDTSRQSVPMTSHDEVVNRDMTTVVYVDSSGSGPVGNADQSVEHIESEAFVDDIHTTCDSVIPMEKSTDSFTEGNVDEDLLGSIDLSPDDLPSNDTSEVGRGDNVLETGIDNPMCDIRKDPAADCYHLDREESSDTKIVHGRGTKKSRRNNGKKQREKGRRGSAQPQKDLTVDEDDVEINFEVQPTSEGIDLVEVSNTQNIDRGKSYGSSDHYREGVCSAANAVDERGMCMQQMYTNPHQEMRGRSQHYRHGYRHNNKRFVGSNRWENHRSFQSEMGRGHHGYYRAGGGRYRSRKRPRGARFYGKRGRGWVAHTHEAWDRRNFCQMGIRGKIFPPYQTEYQQPLGHGWEFANNTHDAENCDATRRGQRKNDRRSSVQPGNDFMVDEDDVDITFEVQSTGEGIDLVEVSRAQNVGRGKSHGSSNHYGKGGCGTVSAVGGRDMGFQRMYTNPHQGMCGSAQYYGHDSTRCSGYNGWVNHRSDQSGKGRGYIDNTARSGGYHTRKRPRDAHLEVRRGGGGITHTSGGERGTSHQPGMYGQDNPPHQPEFQKPCDRGMGVINITPDEVNCDALSHLASMNKQSVAYDKLYPIKSYQNKLEVSFPREDPNDKDKISYDVWYQPSGIDHMEKVKVKYPYQNVTLGNLDIATQYDVHVTKRLNGEEMSKTTLHVSTAACSPPDSFSVKRDCDGTVHLEWHEPAIIAPGYNVEKYTITVSNYLECDVPQGKQFRYGGSIHTASLQLDAETSYIFQIEALCGDQVSEPSKAEILMPKHKMLKTGNKMATKGKPIYLLTMRDTTVDHGKLCRKELGEPSVPGIIRNEKVVLVVGATGSGKTTWINAILNNILDVKYADNFRFKLVIDEDASNQAVSQTQHITIYTIHHQDGFKIDYTLTIIDTPGFGDTRGIQKDKEIEMELRKIFDPQNGCVDHLHAVGFVASASSARLTPTQKYIFTSILSLFGIDIGENIYMLLTFADGKPPQIMSAIKAANVPYQEYFKFNNSAIFDDIGLEDDTDCEMDDESKYFNKMFWDLGMRSFDRFLSKVSLSEAKSLTLTRDVLNERGRMELNVENLNLQVRRGLSKMNQLRIEEKLLKKYEDAIESNKDFTYEIKRLEVKKIPIPDNKNTTTCLTCNFTCHKDCGIPNDGDKAGCWAMDQRQFPVSCTQCPNRCIWHIHRNICYILVQNEITETSTLFDLKARYQAASGKKLTAEQVYQKVHEELEAIETEIKAMMSMISTSLNRLQEIALKNNPMSQIEYLDILIESEINEATPGWQERLKVLRDFRQQAQNIYDISQGEYDPFKTYREQAEKARHEGCDMRHVSTWVKVSNRVKNAVGKIPSLFGYGKD